MEFILFLIFVFVGLKVFKVVIAKRLEAAEPVSLQNAMPQIREEAFELPIAKHEISKVLYHPGLAASGSSAPVIERDDLEFVVLDFETTGLFEAQGDRVVQIALVVLDGKGRVLQSWESKINPNRNIQNSNIHGITNAMVKSAPTFAAIAQEIDQLINGRVIVAHNAKFDLKFLRHELSIAGFDLDPRSVAVFDTMALTYLLGPLANKKLPTVADAVGVDFSTLPGRGLHDALTDTHAEAAILEAYLLLDENRVWAEVHWPLLPYAPVELLSKTQIDERQESLRAWREMRAVIESRSAAEVAGIQIESDSEIYLSCFEWDETSRMELQVKKRGFKVANSLTKSRTRLVVIKNFETMTQTLPKAARWGIPIVTWEQFVAHFEVKK